MTARRREILVYVAIGVLSLAAPWLFPRIVTQLAFLWLMVLFALTWDILGGQMGYNSFGNVVFFGLGMYACAVVQRDSGLSYYPALFAGMACGAAVATLAAGLLGPAVLGLRGHYFAIGTLGLSVAAGDLAAAIEYIGAGSGMTPPIFPGEVADGQRFFYYVLFVLAVATFALLRLLYSRRFGLVVNAIRDDEEKAEAMGLHTTRCKVVAWCVAAFFLGLAGGPTGSLVGFIDPRELAFAGPTFGVWMVLMAILGGRGSLWGPVVGAAIFHATQELFWTYLLGWQRVALGLLIVAIVLFFPQGIVGWIRQRRGRPPEEQPQVAP